MPHEKDPQFLHDGQREIIESFAAELDGGEFRPVPPEARAKASAQWQAMVENASPRKWITRRPRERDIERLEGIARRRGLPYRRSSVGAASVRDRDGKERRE